MPKKKSGGIKNIVVISDTHCGCRMGLCHPNGMPIDDGGTVLPSQLQLKVWAWWEEFWGEWVPMATKGEPYVVVHNGDAIDGVHHNSTTQMSHNLQDQVDLAYDILKPVVDKCDGRYYHIRGTEAHVSKSGREEENLAKMLDAIPTIDNSKKQHARWELWLEMGGELIHFLHHIGTTASSAHESSAVNAEISAMLHESARWGLKKPTIVVRSHRHRSIEVRLPSQNNRYITGVVTPAWQLKTPFTYKIAGARLAPPQIGGILIRLGDEGIFTKTFVKDIKGSPTVFI